MEASDWDRRYAASDLVWSPGPNQWVEELVAPLVPGRALDVAAGEGRNALWLARRGWDVTATDFSTIAVQRMRRLASELLSESFGRLTALLADATSPLPGPREADLVLFSYLQLPSSEWSRALRNGIEAAAPGGLILVVGHAARNLTDGSGGPQDPRVLHDPDDIVDTAQEVAAGQVIIEQSAIRVRTVTTDDGPRQALDSVVLLRRT